MPELPEVETIRRRLEASLIGLRVERASLRRRDMLRADRRLDSGRALLEGARVAAIHRRGKQLVLEGDDGRMVIIHLGMSGRLLLGNEEASTGNSGAGGTAVPPHTHAAWTLGRGVHRCTLLFVDPRRFGWLRALDGREAIKRHWSDMGPDALDLTEDQLVESLRRSNRSIKALLLDQRIVAGLGNIYVDELLHLIRVHPMARSRALVPRAAEAVESIHELLRRAIELGGSTIRDYRDPSGDFGSFQQSHRVYGRQGKPCLRCARERSAPTLIVRTTVAGRGTWHCPRCQPDPIRRTSKTKGLSTRRKQRVGSRSESGIDRRRSVPAR